MGGGCDATFFAAAYNGPGTRGTIWHLRLERDPPCREVTDTRHAQHNAESPPGSGRRAAVRTRASPVLMMASRVET